MPIYRAQLAVHLDGNLPRDSIVITPHFDDHGLGSDPQGLADDLAAAYASFLTGTKRVTCKMYVATGAPPHYPVGEAEVNSGASVPSSCPREVSLCLSFFSERNVPRRRGRVYCPMAALGLGIGLTRPSGVIMGKVAELAPIFEELGGADVDWVVWSRSDQTARPVTDWYVDDEWDTVRSRGLRPTTRITGTTSEA